MTLLQAFLITLWYLFIALAYIATCVAGLYGLHLAFDSVIENRDGTWVARGLWAALGILIASVSILLAVSTTMWIVHNNIPISSYGEFRESVERLNAAQPVEPTVQLEEVQ